MTQGQFFKWSLTGLNSEFSFSETSWLTKAEEPSQPYYLPIAGGRIIGFIPFPRVLVLCEMQSVSSRIWTHITVSISYDDIPIRCYHCGPAWTWKQGQWKGLPKLQHYWSLTIRLFWVISRILIWGCPTLLQRSSWCILQPQLTEPDTQWGSLTTLQRYTWCILQPQLTGLKKKSFYNQ